VNAVVSFLSSQGLTVKSVAANRLTLDVDGTVASVEQAFNIHISNYLLNGHTVYAPTSEPSAPSSLARLILNIGGLDNVSTPHRIGFLAPNQGLMPSLGPGLGYTPTELRSAYDMTSLVNTANGTGQTVGIVELDGYAPSDVNTYLSFYGLGSPKYTNVLLDGATGAPGPGAIEVELDMEVVSAIAPGAAQRIYIAPNSFQSFLDVFNQIVMDNVAKVVSNSWGLCEIDTGTSAMQAFDSVFAAGAAQGQAFFSASGDDGSADCQFSDGSLLPAVDFPASDPFVVGVGGTQLFTSLGNYLSETVWNDQYGSGGGGLSLFWGQPSYQSGPGVTNSFSNGKREVPDVSADADPNTGYSVFCKAGSICNGAGWIEVGGTSAAAPLWAGLATDINQYLTNQSKPTLGSASAQLYQVFNTPQALTAYHDITTGNNDNNGFNNGDYPATAGYDLASGIGTPDAWNLARDIAGDVPVLTPNLIYLTTTPGVDPTPQTVTIQNNSENTYNWTLSGLQSWVSSDQTSGSIPAHSTEQFTLTFTLGNSAQSFTTSLTVKDASSAFNPFSIPVAIVSTNVSKTWYFAEGFTGGSFTEFLTLANPNSTTASVQVQYFLGSGQVIPQTYPVAANSRFTIKVNDEIGPNQNVSVVITSDQPIVAERPIYFTYTGMPGHSIPGGTDVLGATQLDTSFDFGYLDTSSLHDTFLTILNQNAGPMEVTINYFAAIGGLPIIKTHTVNGNSRGTVKVNNEGLPAGVYSALVTLSEPGLVERPMYLVDSITHFTGSADVVGVTTPLPDWDFAEGFTYNGSSGFSERYLLSNPSPDMAAHATVTFFKANGTTVPVEVTIQPGAQVVVDANAVLGNGVNNSAHVHADQPILAERFMSFDFRGTVPGATDVLGAAQPSNLFFFAEGFTGTGFNEFLTIENPDPSATARVQVTFLPANGGSAIVKVFTVAPSSRFTLDTSTITEVKGKSFSMVVESNVSIVAERPMYFTFPPNETGGSDIIGYQP
jgi:hypothetical protein